MPAIRRRRIMRQPTRLDESHGPTTKCYRVETDAGQQTRLLRFGGAPPAASERSLARRFGRRVDRHRTARSRTVWIQRSRHRASGVAAPTAATGRQRWWTVRPRAEPRRAQFARAERSRLGQGSLKVVTTNLKAGYLRKNGVPYSEEAVVTEYFDQLSLFGNEYLQVVTTVTDPKYLISPFVVSSHFKREARRLEVESDAVRYPTTRRHVAAFHLCSMRRGVLAA